MPLGPEPQLYGLSLSEKKAALLVNHHLIRAAANFRHQSPRFKELIRNLLSALFHTSYLGQESRSYFSKPLVSSFQYSLEQSWSNR